MDRRSFLQSVALSCVAASGCRLSRRATRRTLLIAGSSSFMPDAKALMDEFIRAHPDVDAVVEGGGSTAGIVAVNRGAIDLGLMSRDLHADEDDNLDLRTYLVAKDAIGIVVHPSNPLRDLTSQLARDVFEGRITRWEDLPGVAAGVAGVPGAPGALTGPIKLKSFKPTRPTRRAFEEMVLGGGEVFHKAPQLEEPADLRKAVGADPQAIGFLVMRHTGPEVKVLQANGIEMSRGSILINRYPYSRPFFLASNGPPREAAREFVEFCASARGQELLASRGRLAVC